MKGSSIGQGTDGSIRRVPTKEEEMHANWFWHLYETFLQENLWTSEGTVKWPAGMQGSEIKLLDHENSKLQNKQFKIL